MNAKVTVSFGPGNETVVDLNGETTVKAALDAARAKLGFGANVEARVEGTTQPDNAPVQNGDRIAVTPKAGTKGV